ncbi:M14 family zinc carboxypeptidase [Pseudobacteriovorax antillogorgiicola]|uniref:Zinc carboxypeptidase n=1 Tax=Pseudobacteriovorax antillogorgiicola TaxID=1513793 RepID=A0A1Y6BED2_9BACT|nr:M14 family zinc carboxypeptidase [Pseudobacteriovorax antillogorgiicola]TCS56460.1 zinc carboxypeptidase [Pseudobacteriovorax antillogorgiicola]SMF05205.1 Zinc carboxypeptidase [Pseudobacteriovorax antillogorgiicola]
MSAEFSYFPELRDIYECAQNLNGVGEFCEEAWVSYKKYKFPLLSFRFGSEDKNVPKLVLVGGVHGLEKVGTHVVTSYLQTLIRLLKWDQSVRAILDKCQLHIYPLANPVGMYRRTRSNGNGVDIMRNAPIDARKTSLPFVSGHRVSPKIPWYRGEEGEAMELETQVLCDYVRRYTFDSDLAVVLDVHSGFGLIDRLWFPFAFSETVFPDAHKVLALKRLLDHSYPNHIYTVEPQNIHYMAHGDVWDYMYFEHRKYCKDQDRVFVPLCLEMGSWHWIRKNPRQVFSALGIFNPVLPHRLKRTQRRHLLLFDFLLKAVNSGDSWANLTPGQKIHLQKKATHIWYRSQAS